MGQVRILDFSKFHGKPPQGSTILRVHNLIKYWDEAELYKYGENPETLIFQKVYPAPDYTFPENFKGIKILDLCDADWLSGQVDIVRAINCVDAVTCSSEGLTEFIKQFTDKVICIPDRFDLESIPPRKVHKGNAKNVVWFGYSHNADTLKPAMSLIESLGLNLTVISDDNPIANRWASVNYKDKYTYVKYDEDTIYQELQKSDICVLPRGTRPIDAFKSNNKTIKAILAGLPVADDEHSLRRFIEPEQREMFIKDKYDTIKEEYDIRKSVRQYKELINKLRKIG